MKISEEDEECLDDGLIRMETVVEHRIYISSCFGEYPCLLWYDPKFQEHLAKRDTQTYTATYTFIDWVFGSEEELESNKELVRVFLKKHPKGDSITNEKTKKRKKNKKRVRG